MGSRNSPAALPAIDRYPTAPLLEAADLEMGLLPAFGKRMASGDCRSALLLPAFRGVLRTDPAPSGAHRLCGAQRLACCEIGWRAEVITADLSLSTGIESMTG